MNEEKNKITGAGKGLERSEKEMGEARGRKREFRKCRGWGIGKARRR